MPWAAQSSWPTSWSVTGAVPNVRGARRPRNASSTDVALLARGSGSLIVVAPIGTRVGPGVAESCARGAAGDTCPSAVPAARARVIRHAAAVDPGVLAISIVASSSSGESVPEFPRRPIALLESVSYTHLRAHE